MEKTKVVFDTNIWLYYVQRREELQEIIATHNLEVFSSDHLCREIISVFARPHLIKFMNGESFESYFENYFNPLTTEITTERLFTRCPDKNDNFLYDLAREAEAQFLVTEDRRLWHFTHRLEGLKALGMLKFLKNRVRGIGCGE